MSEIVRNFCPWVRSEHTPCVIRDGEQCHSEGRDDPERQCVGCGAPPEAISLELVRQQRLGWRV